MRVTRLPLNRKVLDSIFLSSYVFVVLSCLIPDFSCAVSSSLASVVDIFDNFFRFDAFFGLNGFGLCFIGLFHLLHYAEISVISLFTVFFIVLVGILDSFHDIDFIFFYKH